MSHRCNTTTSTELVHLQPPPNLAPNSQLSFNKLKGWLGECHSKHTACRSFQVEYMPRRLLEMTASAEAPRTRLCTDPPIAPYAALSYCWGRDQLSKTTRERLEQYRRDIPFRELPKTIRDAAKVTLAIGLKYLWVDALCIIQDDDEDKREQISKMCSVYRGAFFTIAASIATTADDGFLHPRIQYRPTKLAARTDDNVFTEVLLSPVYRRLDVVGSPLYLRGWTFQETQLSTRIAAYGEREMTLCCLEDAHIDGGTGRHVVGPTYRGVLDPGNLTFRSSGHPHSWARIIETYSGRSLSVESDKLPAIAALAEEYSLTKAVTDYFAGIWREGFLLYCLWYVPLPPMQRPPSTYVAPSWSWASMVEPISYRWTDIISLTDIEISCVLLDMGTTLASSHRFGIVTGGFMSIRARTRELALFGFDPDRTFGHPSLQAAALTAFHSTDAPNEDVRIECYMDIPTDWAAKTHVPLVGVEICTVGNGKDLVDVEICTDRYETETKAFGLVLEQIDADSYRRVGLLIVLDVDNRDYWFEDGLEPALWRDMLIK
ncbi:heterokaryon incompatibility protein-domain-containing protein [Nemania abortiva]|nr:heterokaryon incompatibility protein-domain-containing protein [Nemania abortiva]